MSNATPSCPQCGTALPADAPAGLCPQCLMALNLGPETVLTEDAAAPRAALPPEQIAPHFPQLEILECLGRGGMGVVYKARQKSLNRLVALKLLAPERVRDPQFAGRFAREAQALAALSHPNIVTIHDFGQAGGFYYLLMELVDGANLRQLLRARKFTPEEALAMVPPLCDALQYAHDRGIVHRDIKPENLLLDKSGRLKVADFGIAKMLGSLPAAEPDSLAAATDATQNALGTPGYRAPEQKSDPGRVDSRADIYSLGVVIYELLTGELPGGRLEPPSRKVRIDVRLDEVVLRALEQKPELRYQQASQVKTMVETIVATPAGEAAAANSGEAEAKGDVVNGEPGILVRLLGWAVLDPLSPKILKGVRLASLILLVVGAAIAAWNPWHVEGKLGLFVCLAFFGPLILLTFFGELGIQKGRESVAPPNPEQIPLRRILRWARGLQSCALLALLIIAVSTGKHFGPEWFFLLALLPVGVELYLYRHAGYRPPPTLPNPNDLAFKLGQKLGWHIASSNARKRPAQPGWHVDYKTEARIGGWPLVHVAYGQDPATGKMRVARGVIAIGNMAQGVVAIGSIATGAFAFGGLAFGGFAYGGLALGLLAVGGGAGGLIAAAGGMAMAPIAIGGLAIGVMAFGGQGIGMYVSDALTRNATAQSFFMPWAKNLMANFQALNFLLVAFVLILGLGLPWWLSRRKMEGNSGTPSSGQPNAPQKSASPKVSQNDLHAGQQSQRKWEIGLVALLFIGQGLMALWDTYSQMGPFNFRFEWSVFCLPIGLGLLRRREFWRKCAVVAVWLTAGFWLISVCAMAAVISDLWQATHIFKSVGSAPLTGPQTVQRGMAILLAMAAVLPWIYRVLTRPHIKALFQMPAPRRFAWLESGLAVAAAGLLLLNGWNFVAMKLGVEFPKSSFGERLSRLVAEQQRTPGQPVVANKDQPGNAVTRRESGPFVAQLDECTVELVAITRPNIENSPCWLANGEISLNAFPNSNGFPSNSVPNMVAARLAFQLRYPAGSMYVVADRRIDNNSGVLDVNSGAINTNSEYFLQVLSPPQAKEVDVSLEIFDQRSDNSRLWSHSGQWVKFRHVSLEPGHKTAVDISTTKVANNATASATAASELTTPTAMAEIEKDVASKGGKNGDGSTAANQPSVKAAPVKPQSFEVEASPVGPLKYNWRSKPEAVSPELVAEPPRLRFWAWQEEGRTNYLGSAHYPDGSSVTNAEDLALLQQLPPWYNQAQELTSFRQLHLWFSHPLFWDSPGSTVDINLRGPGYATDLHRVPDDSSLKPSAKTDWQGWFCCTFNCKAMPVPYGSNTLSLMYTIGAFVEKTTCDAQTGSFDFLPDGAYGTGLGEDRKIGAYVTVMAKAKELGSKQYDVLANLIQGGEKRGQRIYYEPGPDVNGLQGLKFAFRAPLKNIATITIGSRPRRSHTYTVVFIDPASVSEAGRGLENSEEARMRSAAKAFLASRMKLDFSVPVDREQLKVVAEDLAVAERQLQVGVVSPLDYAMIKLTNEVMLAQAKGQFNEAAQLWLDTKAKELAALKNKSQVGVIPPDEYECARLDYESAKAEAGGQGGLAAWFQFRRASWEYGVAQNKLNGGMTTPAAVSRAKLALKRAAAVPALRAEPPRLCFVAWQDEWQKDPSVAARHADGSGITTDEERDWLKNLHPTKMDVSKLNLTPQPRLAHLWIAHPLFDDSSVIDLAVVDNAGQVIPDGAPGHQAGGSSAPDRGNGFCGWAWRTFAPGETRPLDLRLRYAVGPMEHAATVRVAESASLNLTLEGEGGINGVGQNTDGQAFIAVSYLPARLGARQYQAVAIQKNGEELRATDTSLSGVDGAGMCLAKFTFKVPLQQLEAFTVGTRPIRTQVWRNVVLP